MHNFIYVTEKEAKPYKDKLIEMTLELQDLIREYFTFQFHFIGSSERNMITYDPKTNIGYDFDIDYAINDFEEEYSASEIHNIIFAGLQKLCLRYGYNKIEDSTRVITVKKVDPFSSRILHSCDIALINEYEENGECRQEYIRHNKKTNSYMWVKRSAPYKLGKKIDYIKNSGNWNLVRELYLDKKNYNDDPNKKSRSLYAESVKEVYDRLKTQRQ